MWVAARVIPAIASSWGDCLILSFFWQCLGVTLDLGKVVSFAPSLGALLASTRLFSTLFWMKFTRSLKEFFKQLQFFEELKTNVLSLCKNRKAHLSFFTNLEIFPIHLKRLVGIAKILGLGNKSLFWRNLHSFSVPLRYKCSKWSSLGANNHLFEMQTLGR